MLTIDGVSGVPSDLEVLLGPATDAGFTNRLHYWY